VAWLLRERVTGCEWRVGDSDLAWEAGGYDTAQYREGTVQVDIIDLGQPRLLWNTRIEQELSAGYSEENWKKVERAMAAAFKSLPARQ